MVKRVAKRVLYVIAGLVVLLALAIAYTQTQWFRDHVRSFALSRVDSLLNAEVYIGRIGGNLLTGISIDSISIRVDSVSVLSLRRFEADYDVFSISRKTLRIHRITLVEPDIRLMADKDGEWNFLRMIRPVPEDTAADPFDWTIMLDKFEMIDARFALVDSSALLDPAHTPPDPGFLEYHDFRVGSVQVDLAAEISPLHKKVMIRKVAASSTIPAFELRQLQGEFTVRPTDASVHGLTILTGNSSVTLDATVREFDLLGGIDLFELQASPVELTLSDSDISLNELAMFIRDIEFLNGTVSTDLEASGTFGDLGIRKLHLSARQTEFHVTGTVFNLHDPGNLYLDVKFAESRLHSDDARWILPKFDLPDLAWLGRSRFDLKFTGTPTDFDTKIGVRSDAGSVDLDGHLAIGGPNTLTYNGTSTFRHIDLAPLLSVKDSSTSLFGSFRIQGTGVDFRHLRAAVDLSLDTSWFFGKRVFPSRFELNADRDRLSGSVDLALGSLRAQLSTSFERLAGDRPAFNVSGSVSSLNIAEIVDDETHRSDLTMTIDARGEGTGPRDVSGEFRMDLLDSRYRDYLIDSASVLLVLDQRDPQQKTIFLQSDLADINVKGAFDLPFLVDLIAFEQQNLKAAMNQRFVILDSSFAAPEVRDDLDSLARSLAARNVALDMEIDISIKNLEPLSILTREKTFNGVGRLSGTAVGDFSNLAISANLDADEIFYGTSESGFYIHGGTIDLKIEDLKPLRDPFTDLKVRFFTEADDLNINLDRFDSLNVTLVYEKGHAEYNGSGLYGDNVGFVLDGSALVSEESLLLTPHQFHINVIERDWSLQDGASMEFRRYGADFTNIVMVSDTQEVRFAGNVLANGSVKGMLSINRIGLEVVEGLLAGEGSSATPLVAGSASVNIEASGTVRDPRLLARFEARDVAFRGLPFGELRGSIDYEKGKAAVSVSVADDLEALEPSPRLNASGVIPVRLPFGDGEQQDQEFNLHVRSDGIQINFLDPLVPTFEQLSGILRCDLTIAGPPSNLRYDGSFSLDECTFLFVPNNIRYRFRGDFRPKGNRIAVVSAEAGNIPSDNRPGRTGLIRFSGDFGLEEFVPTAFNLVAQGELLVVKPESRSSSLPVYGDLYIETGSGGLHFTGEIESSLLRGDVLVQRSRLVFPPTRSTAHGRSASTIPVVVIDDTSTISIETDESFRARYFLPGITQPTTLEPPARVRKSFLDGIQYDLNVETTGPSSEIKLIFSEIPAEDMQATFQGRWTITGDGTRWIGNFDIDRAQYTFFKQFDATGNLRYTGEFMNPQLNIVARYQSTRTVQNLTDSTSRVERVVVLLKITGTRNEPKHQMSMTIDDIDYYSYTGPKSSDLESDAIAFILAGNFPLTRTESGNIAADIQTSVGASMMVGASSVLTKELSEYLRRETGFITSVELGYEGQGSFSQSADIRLSGTAFKGYWRYRGTILDDPFGNANVSLLYSFGDIFDNTSLRNFMFELERRAETTTSGLIDDRKEINSARLFYRFSF